MKLFEKKRDGCRRICCFCGKKVFSYRRKNSGADVKKTDFEIFDYCKNYQYVLDLFLEERREKREERRKCCIRLCLAVLGARRRKCS